LGKKPEPLLIRIVKVLDSVLASLCAVILGLMIAITLVAIFCRYVLSNALSWTEELTRYLMIVVGMFGTALALWTDDHVGFTALVDRLPAWAQKVCRVISYALVGVLGLIITVEGYKWTSVSGSAKAQILPIPMWIPMSAIPLGGLLLLLVVLAKIVIELRGADKC
jgi:TRAP-type C4-dicarboxylate transport system permease small subunit